MINQNIITRLNNEETKGIYGYMYGRPWLDYGNYVSPDELLFIKKEELKPWRENGQTVGLCFVWGWPGPDYNVYLFKDYGITWGFTEEDVVRPEPPKGKKIKGDC